ncbi:MAG: response regulator [Deltaproteobacteria bacterium]|nr:response regulator [Deltaproteobacteria bacterium]
MEIFDPTLLIVDDDRNARRAMVRELDDLGNILDVESAEEALKVLGTRSIHVVLSDHDMPGMCGLDLLRNVKLRWPTIQRLMITGSDDFQVAVRAINLGEVSRFVTKPWREDELRCSVRQAIEHAGLEAEVRHLREQARHHKSTLDELEERFPGITRLRRDPTGAILLDEAETLSG